MTEEEEHLKKQEAALQAQEKELVSLLSKQKYLEFYRATVQCLPLLFRHVEVLRRVLAQCDAELAVLGMERSTASNWTQKTGNARRQIPLINIILRCGEKFEDSSKGRTKAALRRIKLRLLVDYANLDESMVSSQKIPLNQQMTELSLTEEPSYVRWLVREFIHKSLWSKALYCVWGCRLLGDTTQELKQLRAEILARVPQKQPQKGTVPFPGEGYLLLDANLLISLAFPTLDKRIPGDVSEAQREEMIGRINKMKKNAKVIITAGAEKEKDGVIEAKFRKQARDANLKPHEGFAYEEKIKKYYADARKQMEANPLPALERDTSIDLESFYNQFLTKLEDILTDKKLRSTDPIPKQLLKLADRGTLHPEEGDFELLRDAIRLHRQSGKPVTIATRDSDFTEFAGEILDTFGVYILGFHCD